MKYTVFVVVLIGASRSFAQDVYVPYVPTDREAHFNSYTARAVGTWQGQGQGLSDPTNTVDITCTHYTNTCIIKKSSLEDGRLSAYVETLDIEEWSGWYIRTKPLVYLCVSWVLRFYRTKTSTQVYYTRYKTNDTNDHICDVIKTKQWVLELK